MATIIRVKRRRSVDPVENLKVSCKKRRGEDDSQAGGELDNSEQIESQLEFAGTLESRVI